MNGLIKAIESSLDKTDWLIALDRDGTLVPYAPRPELARVDERLQKLMNALVSIDGFRIAIVSARSTAQLEGDFPGQGNLIMAGNYGMEVKFPDGRLVIQPQALAAVPEIKRARDELASRVHLDKGAILEDHGYSLCLHWQNVPIAFRDDIHAAVHSVSDREPKLRIRTNQSSYEFLPNIPWDKGFAVNFIDANLGAPNAERIYFYGGDTDADTPAFRWVNDHDGITVRVGAGNNLEARFRLETPAQLLEALDYVVARRSGGIGGGIGVSIPA